MLYCISLTQCCDFQAIGAWSYQGASGGSDRNTRSPASKTKKSKKCRDSAMELLDDSLFNDKFLA